MLIPVTHFSPLLSLPPGRQHGDEADRGGHGMSQEPKGHSSAPPALSAFLSVSPWSSPNISVNTFLDFTTKMTITISVIICSPFFPSSLIQ